MDPRLPPTTRLSIRRAVSGDPATASVSDYRADPAHDRAREDRDHHRVAAGAPRAGRAARRRLLADKTVAVVTGQQAGLWRPALHALQGADGDRAAEQVARPQRAGRRSSGLTPRTTTGKKSGRTVFDEGLTPRGVSPAARRRRTGTRRHHHTRQSILEALDQIGLLPPTEFGSLTGRRRGVRAWIGMADAFGRWMEEVLGNRGLIADSSTRRRAAVRCSRELNPGRRSLAALAGRTSRRAATTRRFTRADDASRCSTKTQPPRDPPAGRPLRRRRPAAAASLVAQRRGRVTLNVLLVHRAGHDLPHHHYVAGPNELYLGQLRGAPALACRCRSSTCARPRPFSILPRCALRVPACALQAQDRRAERAVEDADSSVVEESFSRRENHRREITPLACRHHPCARRRATTPLDGCSDRSAGRYDRRRRATAAPLFIHARALAFPGGHAQERTIVFSLWNEHAFGACRRLDEELLLDIGRTDCHNLGAGSRGLDAKSWGTGWPKPVHRPHATESGSSDSGASAGCASRRRCSRSRWSCSSSPPPITTSAFPG